MSRVKNYFSEHYAVLIQLFIQAALFCLVSSAIIFNEEASLKDALAFISIYFIVQFMTFNNMTGYGGKLCKRSKIYETAYHQFESVIKSLLGCSEGFCYLPEFVAERDKADYEMEIKRELTTIYMTYEDWIKTDYIKLSNRELRALGRATKGAKATLTKKQVKTFIAINGIRHRKTNVDELTATIKKHYSDKRKVSKATRIVVANTFRIVSYIANSILFTYVLFNKEVIDGSTVSNYLIKSIPILWTIISGIRFGFTLGNDTIATFNGNVQTIIEFFQWLKRVKSIEPVIKKDLFTKEVA